MHRPDIPVLLMFFYGTLKRGHANHDAFCRGPRFVDETTVRGTLYDLPLGYPALIVPREDVLAVGTADPVEDVLTSRRLDRSVANPADGPRAFGELFAFDDLEARFQIIDDLEGFDPETGLGYYRRVLLPVETVTKRRVLAWAYVVKETAGRRIQGGRWLP